MLFDSVIIGGGPAGLSAALVLGRAKRKAILFDDNRPRNAVTQESHGFLTRDGIEPTTFREIAHQEISAYASVSMQHTRVTSVTQKHENLFELVADNGTVVEARTIIIASGLKETLPEIAGIHDFYGRSLFNCPYCDGWELRDQPLIVIAEEGAQAFHLGKLVWNWSRDLLVCTNGRVVLTEEQKETLQKKGIQVVEDRITALEGRDGILERVVFATHKESRRQGGFIVPHWQQATDFGVQLGCETNAMGGLVTDRLGRTSVKGVYAAGEATLPSQLLVSAAEGSMAAAGVNAELVESAFLV